MNLQNNMHQLIYEFLEQTFEEARAGYCTKVEISLLPGGQVKITDNGRGLPFSKDLHGNKAVLDKVLSGSPITNAEYSQMGDLNSAGLQTVNSLCEELQVTVTRDGAQYQQDYICGIAQHDLTISDSVCASGTEIMLKPIRSIFGDTVFSQELLDKWLKDRSADIVNLKVNVISNHIL
ncbi:MAG: gyrase subunit [Anaerocolumna sp.]|jgi:DNA gyrase/topoisomerase IV subunit B|nr:gyrase subunit [Anaerocolumna sp.]